MVQLKLGADDWDTFGGPEWIDFDIHALNDLPFNVTDPWEREIRGPLGSGPSIRQIVHVEVRDDTAVGIKGIVWLARKMAGIDAPSWEAFNIKTMQVRSRATPDVDPPTAGSSAE